MQHNKYPLSIIVAAKLAFSLPKILEKIPFINNVGEVLNLKSL